MHSPLSLTGDIIEFWQDKFAKNVERDARRSGSYGLRVGMWLSYGNVRHAMWTSSRDGCGRGSPSRCEKGRSLEIDAPKGVSEGLSQCNVIELAPCATMER
jgi:hypothetical protein